MREYLLTIPGSLYPYDLSLIDDICSCVIDIKDVVFLRFEKVHSRYHVRGFFYDSRFVYVRSFGSKRDMLFSVQDTVDRALKFRKKEVNNG